jgi:fatty-acid desaturase
VFNWKAALEGGPIYWVVTHRIHHAHADGPGDPHNTERWRVVVTHGMDSERYGPTV